jgi:NADPH:quinone reductase-like Zn-dependent oxidoreductase
VPDSKTLHTMAKDVLAGKLKIPIDRMVSLSEAGKAHAAAEKGGIGKILLLA